MTFDRKLFFDAIRVDLFSGTMTQPEVTGTSAILSAWEKHFVGSDLRWLAYCLATAFHETGARMVPVRETFADSDKQAIARLESAWGKGQLKWVKTPYWRPDANGKAWFGRGHVQLTHEANYQGALHAAVLSTFNVDIHDEPSAVLRPDVSAYILIEGMLAGVTDRGDFTGKSVEDYFNDTIDDPVGARRVVNGTDRAELIAGYYVKFLKAVKASWMPSKLGADVSQTYTSTPIGEPILQFFAYGHLPRHLREVSLPFSALAENIVQALPNNSERDEALRKLLEAKDCAVRAKLYVGDV